MTGLVWFAEGEQWDRRERHRSPYPAGEGRQGPRPPEEREPRPRFELSAGLRTSILFFAGLATLGFEFFVRPFLGLDPSALVIAAGLTLLGLPLFLGLPGAK